jgi:hypothetical protein
VLIVARTLTAGALVSVLGARIRCGSVRFCFCAANPFALWFLSALSRLPCKLELVQLPNPPTRFSAVHIKDEQGMNSRHKVQLSVVHMLREVAALRNTGGLPATDGWLPDQECGPLQMHLSLLAARQLLDYAFLWQYAQSNSKNCSEDASTWVLVPRKWWRRFIVDWSAASAIKIRSPIIPEVPFENLLVRVRERYRKLRSAVTHIEPVEWFQPEFLASLPKQERNSPQEQTTRVGVLLLDSIDPRGRCNAPWYWSADFRRSGVVFLIWDQMTSGRIPRDVIDCVRDNGGIIYRQGAKTAKAHPDVPQWRASAYRRSRFVISRLLSLARRLGLHDVFKPGFLWHLSGTIRLILKSSWWYDFFERNEIGVFAEVELDTDATTRALAMKALGGIVVAAHRSMEYDHFQFRAERYADVFMYSGVHDLRQTVDLSSKKSVVLTGFPSSTTALSRLPSNNSLRSQFNTALPVVTFLDEGGLIYGFAEVTRAYGAILDDLEANGDYTLLVKSKRLGVFRAATSGRESQVQRLTAKRKLVLFDPACPAGVPFSVSDVVVTVPSTAMFEAMHLGCRTAILNPYRTISNLFYNHGLAGTVIFEDTHTLLKQLRGFLNGTADTFGDCSTFLSEIDPYGDRDGIDRTAYLIDALRDACRNAPSAQEAVEESLSRFKGVWGDGVVGSGEDLVKQAARSSHLRNVDPAQVLHQSHARR